MRCLFILLSEPCLACHMRLTSHCKPPTRVARVIWDQRPANGQVARGPNLSSLPLWFPAQIAPFKCVAEVVNRGLRLYLGYFGGSSFLSFLGNRLVVNNRDARCHRMVDKPEAPLKDWEVKQGLSTACILIELSTAHDEKI